MPTFIWIHKNTHIVRCQRIKANTSQMIIRRTQQYSIEYIKIRFIWIDCTSPVNFQQMVVNFGPWQVYVCIESKLEFGMIELWNEMIKSIRSKIWRMISLVPANTCKTVNYSNSHVFVRCRMLPVLNLHQWCYMNHGLCGLWIRWCIWQFLFCLSQYCP